MWNKDATVLLKLGKPTAIGGRGLCPGAGGGAIDLEKKKTSNFGATAARSLRVHDRGGLPHASLPSIYLRLLLANGYVTASSAAPAAAYGVAGLVMTLIRSSLRQCRTPDSQPSCSA